MSDAAIEAGTLNERYHFLIRRLHSLSGIIPVGAFLCVHLTVNATIAMGGGAFQYAVDQIHKLNNLGILKAVEVAFIFAPIAFHGILGVVIWLSGRSNVTTFTHGGNIRYFLQRVTGLMAFAFIILHLWHVHWIIPGAFEFDPHAAAGSAAQAMQPIWAGPVYAIGMLAAVYHLANGVWTFLITWGVTIGPKSQAYSGRVCIALGIVLALFGLSSIFFLKRMDTTDSASPASQSGHAAMITEDAGPA